MPAFAELIDGYKRFRTGPLRYEKAHYESLGAGQDPDIMVIGCADSRVEPSEIFDTIPRQMFVVRNVANLVPPYETGGGHLRLQGAWFEIGSGDLMRLDGITGKFATVVV